MVGVGFKHMKKTLEVDWKDWNWMVLAELPDHAAICQGSSQCRSENGSENMNSDIANWKIGHPQITFHLPTINFQGRSPWFREGTSQTPKRTGLFPDKFFLWGAILLFCLQLYRPPNYLRRSTPHSIFSSFGQLLHNLTIFDGNSFEGGFLPWHTHTQAKNKFLVRWSKMSKHPHRLIMKML